MLGNSVEGIGKMWACEAKYSGWVKLQPSPLWRVKVTHRKGSGILDVAFSKFKDISKQISVKSLCDFGGNAPTLAFYSHIKTLLGRRPWFASKVTSGSSIQSSGNICWYLGGVGWHSWVWTLAIVRPLEALKREQASQVTQTPTLYCPSQPLLASWHRGDAPITLDTQSTS